MRPSGIRDGAGLFHFAACLFYRAQVHATFADEGVRFFEGHDAVRDPRGCHRLDEVAFVHVLSCDQI